MSKHRTEPRRLPVQMEMQVLEEVLRQCSELMRALMRLHSYVGSSRRAVPVKQNAKVPSKPLHVRSYRSRTTIRLASSLICVCLLLRTQEAQAAVGEAVDLRQQLQVQFPTDKMEGLLPPTPHPLMHGCTWCGGTTTILLFLICDCLPLLHTQEAQSSAGEAADLRQQLQAKPQLSTYGWPPPLPPPSPLAPCTVVPGMTSGTNTNNFLPGCLPLCEQGLQATAGEAAELRRQLQAQSLQSTWMAISPPFSPLSFSSPPSQASGTAIPGMWLPPDCPLFENAGG